LDSAASVSVSVDVCDLDRLGTYLRDELGDDRPITLTGRATGGSSNITLFLDVGTDHYVLRRPPVGPLLPTAHDMLREYRFISAVHGTGVPVAEPIAACEDPEVIGAPFLLLRRVDGFILADPASQSLAATPEEHAGVMRSLVMVLARLHSLDWAALGLAARDGSYLNRQVRRWTSQIDLTPTATRLGPALTEITDWVQQNIPEAGRECIVHGDYTLNNVIVTNPPGCEIAAVVDWEMATIGDPLTDVVWMLKGWGAAPVAGAENPSNWITRAEGALTADGAVELYERETGATFRHRQFYEAFCAWKGIAILEGLYASYVAGTAADPSVAAFEHTIPVSVEQLHASLT
jgi:aminoglycoside phosphotransferase (APT) family kinase protein